MAESKPPMVVGIKQTSSAVYFQNSTALASRWTLTLGAEYGWQWEGLGKAYARADYLLHLATRITALNVIALLLEFGLAIPIGVMAATRRDTWLDKGLTVFVFLGFAVPTFWLALLLMYLFGVKLNWLPVSGLHSLGAASLGAMAYLWDMAQHLILPVCVASFGSLAGMSRYMRSAMLNVIGQLLSFIASNSLL